jgi:hypothetical protein
MAAAGAHCDLVWWRACPFPPLHVLVRRRESILSRQSSATGGLTPKHAEPLDELGDTTFV